MASGALEAIDGEATGCAEGDAPRNGGGGVVGEEGAGATLFRTGVEKRAHFVARAAFRAGQAFEKGKRHAAIL